MEDRRLSPYVFRPILEPSEESPGHQASNQTSGGARSRVCSGDLWPSQCIASPTGALRGSVAVNPKLLTCYKLSQETWSSAGSRHSSRPGSSLASSRPSSQCASLYCRSNNSSLSDVSVARNFQQLTVSNRRQAYKTQKWSHSHEPNGGNGQPAGGSIGSAQSSPGRRRQASLQQKSLDLDSGYLGSSVGDLKSWASHSQSSWNEQVGANRGSNTTTSGIGHLDFQSPIGEIKQEDFTEDDFSARCASLPSFHESFQPGSQMNRDARCLNLMDSGLTGLNLPPEESFDDLDEEIKLIVARGNQDNTIQRFCDEADEVIPEKRDRLIEPEKFIRPEPVSLCISREGSRNPLLSHSGGVVSIVTDTSKSVEPGSSGLPPRPRRLIRSRRIYEEQEQLPKDDPPNQGKSLASGWCDNESNYKMHFEDQQLISSFRVPHHHFLGSDGNLSPDTIGCSPHLPNCTPVNSPPATVGSPGGHLSGHPSSNPDGRIFQFPPPEQLQRNCRDDWGLDQQQGFGEAGSLSNAAAASSPMAVSPSDLSTLNTPRSSLASAHSRNSPMNTDHVIAPSNQNQEAGIDDLYLTYLDEEIGFCPEAIGGGNTNPYLLTSFNLDAVPISGFPSPPGSGYSSPAPGYMDSVNDLPSVISVASYDTESKHDPDPEYVLSPYVPLHRRSELHATSSTPDPESFLSSDTCPETPDGSVKEEVDSPDTGAYVCLWDYCNEEFETQKSFVDHLNEAHTETKKGCDEFPCLWKDCSRKLKPFNAKYKLITHMRVHTKEKPYRCTYENCNRAFARSENRKIHVRSHTGQKPFSCKFSIEFNCSKKFSNSSDRAKHEQTHKDPKPYKCEVLGCTKRYTDPSSLRKHVKGHTQEEQMQYRKAKDLANQAKRSVSPTTRYWMIESSDRHISEYPSQLASSTSLVLPALQSGGTLYTIDSGDGYDQSRSLEGRKVEQKQETSHKQSSEGHLQSLVHQPDSLDDLDNDTIPFDNIPVRYDSPELYELQASWNEDGNQGSSSSMMQM